MTSQDFRDNQLRSNNSDLYQNLDNAEIDGGMQALQGDGNTQILGQVLTFNHTEITQISADQVKSQELIESSPYKGLKTFEPEDQNLFFGRSQFITSLVDQLEKSNLVLLLGASGSGKSSVVRAGLIPWLSQKWHPRFVKLILTPDLDPFESLYGSLLSKYKQSEAQIAREAKADTLSLVIQKFKKSDEYWLILIDQFEELFTLSQPEKRDRFIEALVKFNQTKQNSVKILATMRADFMDKLSPYAKLIKATDKHRPMIAEMEVDELRLAIEQPAAHHGVVFESGLVDEIIKNIQGQKGYLPLLQYTLNLLWETEFKKDLSQERTLNISTYHDLGWVQGALQQHVDAIYNSLSKEKQLAVKRIFLKLVDIGEDVASGSEWKPVRRRTSKSVFSSEQEQQVLNELINENLLVSDLSPENQESTIDITHEILLTSWTTLNDWIKENRLAISLRNRLNHDMNLWKARKCEDELWSGAKLERVVELRKDPTFNQVLGGFSSEENEFIDLSLGRRERQRHRTQISLTIFSLIALTLTGLAGWQWRLAMISRNEALSRSSHALFIQDKKFDALLEALQAAISLQRLKAKPSIPVIAALRQAVYGVQEKNRLKYHQGAITSLTFSPDGKTLASGSTDTNINLRNMATGKLIPLKGHQSYIWSLAFSPDGKILASGSQDKTIKIWDVVNNKLITTFNKHKNQVYSVAFSADGKILASGSGDETVQLWDVGKRQLIATLNGENNQIYTVAFSPNSKILAVGGASKTITLWDIDKRKAMIKFKGHENVVYSVAFSPDGKTLASGSGDKTIKLWNVATGEEIVTFKGHNDAVYNLRFSPDGKTLASGSADQTIKLWNIVKRQEITSLSGHSDVVMALAFSPNKKLLASGSVDTTIKLWDLEPLKPITLQRHKNTVLSIAFSPNGKVLASGSRDKTIKLWDVATGQLMTTLNGHEDAIYSVVFSPNGETLASGSTDKTIKLWDVATGQLITTLKGHNGEIYSLAFNRNGKILASSGADKTIKLWDVAAGQLITTLEGHNGEIYSLAFSPNGEILASGSTDKTIKIWDVATSQLVQTLKGHDKAVYSVAFSPNGKILASGSADRTIKLWNVATSQELTTFFGHESAVYSVTFSPDGETLASGSFDKMVKLWDRETGKEINSLYGHTDPINSVKFSPDGKILATGSQDTTIKLWDFNFSHLIQLGCSWVHNYLQSNSHLSSQEKNLCRGIEKI